MSGKRYLLTPGPTPVPPEVLAAMARADGPPPRADFRAVYERCLERLQQVFRTRTTSSCTAPPAPAAMESAVANLCSPGDRVRRRQRGDFGERWVRWRAAYGCDVDVIELRVGRDAVGRRSRGAAAERGGDGASS